MHDFDKELGQRLKMLRLTHRYSQQAVGNVLEVSFQQIQKYETGKNRISAKSLYMLRNLYQINFDNFFEGMPVSGLGLRTPGQHMRSVDDMFNKITSKPMRRIIRDLIAESSKESL